MAALPDGGPSFTLTEMLEEAQVSTAEQQELGRLRDEFLNNRLSNEGIVKLVWLEIHFPRASFLPPRSGGPVGTPAMAWSEWHDVHGTQVLKRLDAASKLIDRVCSTLPLECAGLPAFAGPDGAAQLRACLQGTNGYPLRIRDYAARLFDRNDRAALCALEPLLYDMTELIKLPSIGGYVVSPRRGPHRPALLALRTLVPSQSVSVAPPPPPPPPPP